MSSIDTARWEMIEAGGRTVQTFGLNRLLGQIYTLLYLNPEPLALDELASELSVSKASVSIACRQLTTWGALRQVWQRGDRKDYYTAEHDFKALIKNGILDSLTKKLESAERQIARSMEILEERTGDPEQVAFLKSRLKEAERFRSRVHRLMDNNLLRKLL